ncbi:MAG: hypothetical protein K6F37_05745 [Lachnospiraceae bacterium]|nr:hypothetical protein [Lachnospiraceae bacterium]
MLNKNNIPTDKSGRPVRVINSNAALDEMLQRMYKDQLSVEEDKVETDIPEEAVEEVSHRDIDEEAERILADARAQAEQIVAEANANAEQIRNDAYEKGLAEGRDAGYSDGYENGSKEFDDKLAELDGREAELEAKYENEMTELEPHLLDVILGVIDKVFRVQFSGKRDLLLYLINNAVMNIEKATSFEIHVSESQKDYVENHKDEIIERVGEGIKLDIVSDSSIEEDHCTIVTDTGVFECGFGAQLDNLIRDLISLVR